MQTVSRLTDQFIPNHYELSVDLSSASDRTFSGTVTIHGASTPNSEHITLHAKELIIESVTLDGDDADFAASDNDELAITVPGFVAGEHTIVIKFQGEIKDAMHGLYPCYYEHDGVKKELFATQFESHHAREVFPCVDEPGAKATFDVTLTTKPGITVLSNMPLKSQETADSLLVSSFDRSPRMSTYLLAWVIGERHSKSAKTKDGVEVNIWATPAQSTESLDYALETAVKAIEFYGHYFDTPYPLPKSDHVALPDFSAGAMENWGLITYREIALLADPKTAGISTRQYVTLVVCHELAHMWFGNLVTMKWWNNLWLNESFATMMEYLAMDNLHPEWNIWNEFASNEPLISLRRDSIDGVQPVQTDVHHPDEISTLFDGAIVYAKGARLLRMLESFVGDDTFQVALKQYFKDFAYSNTEGDDLWNAVGKASGKDITAIMNTWVSQPGFPVVHVTQKDGEVTLTQEQFFVGPHEPSDALWPIPLESSSADAPELFDTKSVTFKSSDVIRLNVDDSAHFITHYDEVTLAAIIDQIDTLSPVNRIQLLNESTLLARGGILPTAQLIPLLDAYKNETSEHVWGIIGVALAELRKFVEDSPEAEAKLRQLSGRIAQSQYERLGWEQREDETEEDTKLRSTVIGLTLYSQDEDALTTAKKYYDTVKLEDLDPELRPLILSNVAYHGDAKIVDDLLAIYNSTQSSELRNDITLGVTSTRVPEKIAELLDAIKNPDIVRPQDVFRWFVYMIRGRDSRVPTWQWIRDNWQWVVDTFGGDKSYDDFPRYSASGLVTRQQFEEYREFFEPKKNIPALARVIAMGISEIEGRVELIERDKDAVQKTLLNL